MAGISRRGLNDPSFHRLELSTDHQGQQIDDVAVYAMASGAACSFNRSYSFAEVYAPHFGHGITVASVRDLVQDKAMAAQVQDHAEDERRQCAPQLASALPSHVSACTCSKAHVARGGVGRDSLESEVMSSDRAKRTCRG